MERQFKKEYDKIEAGRDEQTDEFLKHHTIQREHPSLNTPLQFPWHRWITFDYHHQSCMKHSSSLETTLWRTRQQMRVHMIFSMMNHCGKICGKTVLADLLPAALTQTSLPDDYS